MNVITEEKIIEAAERLVAEGKNPTQVTVREALGGGSFATIGPALKRWKDGQKEDHALAEIRVPEAVTERLVQLQGAVWQVAVDEAERRLVAEREALKVAQDAAAAEVAEQLEIVAMLEAEASEQAQRISNLEENENGLSVHIHNLSSELATAKKEHKDAAHAALDEIAAAAIRTDAAIDRAVRAEAQFDAGQKEARADRDAAAKQLREDLNEQKKAHDAAIQTLNKEIENARSAAVEAVKTAEQLEREAQAFAANLKECQSKLDAAIRETGKALERIKEAEEKADAAITEAAELRGELKAIKDANNTKVDTDSAKKSGA